MTGNDIRRGSQPGYHPEALKASFRNIMEPLLVLFNKAVSVVMKGRDFYIAYSIPGGVYGYFTDHPVSKEELEKIAECIRGLINGGNSFSSESLSKQEIARYFENTNRKDIIKLLDSKRTGKQPDRLYLARIDGYAELLLNQVNENLERLRRFRIQKFKDGFFLIADPDFFERVMPECPTKSKYFTGFDETEETMKHLGIASFAELNDVITREKLPEFIKLSEAWQNRRISQIADQVIDSSEASRLVFIAGPTSSGKTTSANRLAIELRVMKKKAIILSLDNFYLPHSAIPDDPETGMKNFEQLSALDLGLFKRTINDLLAGKSVRLPKYHFDGKGATPDKQSTQITNDTVVIVEGIHGLNPGLWKDAMDTDSYRLYVSALSTLNIHDHLPFSTSDHRLIRRLVRDHLFRGYSFNETIRRWPDIMQNEYLSIFPYQESAHTIFNSALIYEPAVFAHYAPEIVRDTEAENEHIRTEVKRINRILSLLVPIDPKDIPPTSILREFIGGSSFQYS